MADSKTVLVFKAGRGFTNEVWGRVAKGKWRKGD